jgi:hypothetical protein
MKNWKTTLIGLVIAIGNVALPLIQQGTVTTNQILISCGFALIGFLAKDFDKTGIPKNKEEVLSDKPENKEL